MEETTPTFGNTRRNEKGRRRLEVYREGQQEDLAMVGERENDDDDNLKLGDDGLV